MALYQVPYIIIIINRALNYFCINHRDQRGFFSIRNYYKCLS